LRALLQRLLRVLGQGLVWGGWGSPKGRGNGIEKMMKGEREEGAEGVSARRTGGYGGMTKS